MLKSMPDVLICGVFQSDTFFYFWYVENYSCYILNIVNQGYIFLFFAKYVSVTTNFNHKFQYAWEWQRLNMITMFQLKTADSQAT